MKIRVTTFLFLSFFSISWALAQESTPTPTPPKKDVILSTSLTGNTYYGDMNYSENLLNSTNSPYFSVNPGVNLSIYTDHPRFFRPAFSAGYGRIVGQNSTFQPTYYTNSYGEPVLAQPTRYVRTDYVYGDATLRFTPIRRIARFDPYLSAGVGGFFFRPVKIGTNGEPLPLGGLKANSYSAAVVSFPLAAGMDINLGRKVSLNVGASLRLPMTDFIDNTGSNYGGNYNVQEGNDKILAMNVGANFRIFDSEKLPKIFRFPELFFSEQKKSEPEDTLILASALDISEHPEFLAPKTWQSHDPSAKRMKGAIGELVLTSECDSIARKYEERIANLSNENLQIRGEYSKLAQEASKLRDENNNYALKEKVVNEKLAELSPKSATGAKPYSGVAVNKAIDSLTNVINKLKENSVQGMAENHSSKVERDSLVRVIAEKEQTIADLETKSAPVPLPAPKPNRQAGEATEEIAMIAVYEGQVDSLKDELRRLEGKYSEIKSESDILNGQNRSLKDRLKKANETNQIASAGVTEKESLDILQYEKKIDSLTREQERIYTEATRYRTENEALKRKKVEAISPSADCTAKIDSMNLILTNKQEELAILHTQYNELAKQKSTNEPNRQQDLASIQKQVAGIMDKVAQLQLERDEARRENDRLVTENESLKNKEDVLIKQNANQAIVILIQKAQQRVDSMNAYFTALQKNIDGYERKINQLRSENDSLLDELRIMNRMVNGGKEVEEVKVADLQDKLKKANEQVAKLDAQLAEAKAKGVPPTDMSGEIQDLKNQLADAQTNIKVSETKNKELLKEYEDFKSRTSSMTPPNSGVAAKTNENESQKVAELESKVASLQSTREALIGQIEDLEGNVKKLEEDNQVLRKGGSELSEADIASFTSKIEFLQKQVDSLYEVNIALNQKTSNPTARVEGNDLLEKNKQLQKENEEMITKVSSLEIDNKQLAGENDLLRKNATKNSAELEDLRPKTEKLQAQNSELEQRLMAANEKVAVLENAPKTTTPASNDKNEELTAALDRIKSLEKDNEIMKGQIIVLSEDNKNPEVAQIPVFKERIAALEDSLRRKPVVNIAADKLDAENERLAKEKEELETALAAKTSEVKNLKAINEELSKDNKPTSPSADVATAQAKIEDLNKQLAKKEERIVELEALANTPSSAEGKDDRLAQLQINYNKLQADSAVWIERVKLAENGESQLMVMGLMEENQKLKNENEVVKRIKETIAAAGITPEKAQEFVNAVKENEALKQKLSTLQPTTSSTPLAEAKVDNTELNNQIASLTTANKTLKEQLEKNTEEVSRLMKEKDDWELRAKELAAKDSVSHPNAARLTEVEGLKTQLIALKAENETLKAKLADKTAADDMQALQERLAVAESELAKKETMIDSLKAMPMVDKSEDLAKLEKQNTILSDENRTLKAEIAKIDAQPKPEVADKSEELEGQIAALKNVIAEKDQEIEDLKAKPTVVKDNGLADLQAELTKLKNENLRLNEENGYLNDKLAGVKVIDPNVELQSKIDELKAEVEAKNKLIANLESKDPNTNGVADALSTKDGALNSRDNELEMREKKLNQRENYITLKEEEIHRNEKKYEYLNAKEIELRLSEQRITGFYSKPENMLLDGAPCQYVTAFLEKDDVMNKIDDYFLGMGYNYRLENGKMVYSNIVIPEVSNKPLNIAFYMRIADTGKRTLQGVFRFTNGTYVNEDKFPAETIKAIKLLQKLAQ